jgi:hypothetical protein
MGIDFGPGFHAPAERPIDIDAYDQYIGRWSRPHPFPHFASARAVVKASVLATAALNACNSGASLCSGMFGNSS